MSHDKYALTLYLLIVKIRLTDDTVGGISIDDATITAIPFRLLSSIEHDSMLWRCK